MLNGILNARLQRERGVRPLFPLARPGTEDRNQEKHPKDTRTPPRDFSYILAVHGLSISISESVQKATALLWLLWLRWTEKGIELCY
jgi:hypothetical protein